MLQLTCQQCREADRIAIEEFGVPSLTLMENAGTGCAKAIMELNFDGQVTILCGPGNNGGDGFVIARLLHEANVPVSVVLLCNPKKYRGDALANLNRLKQLSLPVVQIPTDATPSQVEANLWQANHPTTGCLVDAMLGTGATGSLRPPYESVIALANEMNVIRIAIDVPTGMNCDTAKIPTVAFRADLTCTFIAVKPAMNTQTGLTQCGEVRLIDIGLPDPVFDLISE
jgi:NAD(P)H-hydrate epimerase